MATRIREKAKVRKETADKRPRATARYVRISSRKVKIVIDLIRGKNVDDALAILKYTPKAASPVVYKLLNSAIANAVNNNEMDRKSLYVAEPRPHAEALRCPFPRQRVPHPQAHQPHQRCAGSEVIQGRFINGSESKSPRCSRWRYLQLEHPLVCRQEGFRE